MDAWILSKSIKSDTTTAEGKQEKINGECGAWKQWVFHFSDLQAKSFLCGLFFHYFVWEKHKCGHHWDKEKLTKRHWASLGAFHVDGSAAWTVLATAGLAWSTKQREMLVNSHKNSRENVTGIKCRSLGAVNGWTSSPTSSSTGFHWFPVGCSSWWEVPCSKASS